MGLCNRRLAVIVIFLYVGFLLLLAFSPSFQREIVFLHHVSLPLFANLSDPESMGLTLTRNIEISVGNEALLKGWVVSPHHSKLLPDVHGEVVLYFHGTVASRGKDHRVHLYKLLSQFGFHVVTIDYRGFADSTGSPSEEGLIEDAWYVWEWANKEFPGKKIHLWGHSMGSGVTMGLVPVLSNKGIQPASIVLEAPFTSLLDACKRHPITVPFRGIIEYADHFLLDTFDSISRLPWVSHDTPLLIVHSTGDEIVPYELGLTLYNSAKKLGINASMETFHGVNHRRIVDDHAHLVETLVRFWGLPLLTKNQDLSLD